LDSGEKSASRFFKSSAKFWEIFPGCAAAARAIFLTPAGVRFPGTAAKISAAPREFFNFSKKIAVCSAMAG
jgi:hypothetical protein